MSIICSIFKQHWNSSCSPQLPTQWRSHHNLGPASAFWQVLADWLLQQKRDQYLNLNANPKYLCTMVAFIFCPLIFGQFLIASVHPGRGKTKFALSALTGRDCKGHSQSFLSLSLGSDVETSSSKLESTLSNGGNCKCKQSKVTANWLSRKKKNENGKCHWFS